jgi:signal transduction histidine kinase
MVRKPRDTAYYMEKTGACLEEVNRMSVLVDQLLLLARYEKDVSPCTLAMTSLPDLMNNIIVRHANDLEKKGISLYLNIHEDLAVLTDAFMTEQILENIFSNALKYSYANSTIGIFSNNTDHQTSLTIKDEGIGMNKEELSQIFERFYRADESRNFQVKGYGLGLAIARRFADLLQITIQVESQPRKGSAFTLVFPGSPEKDLNEF